MDQIKLGSYKALQIKIGQYHKETKKLDAFVPYRSAHRKHTINHLPRNLFDRALSLNQDKSLLLHSYTTH